MGTDATGSVALGNSASGIFIQGGEANLIGGPTAGKGNLISGQRMTAASISTGQRTMWSLAILSAPISPGRRPWAICGNWCWGIRQPDWRCWTGERNVISGNLDRGYKIKDLTTSDNRVIGNYIGTDLNGTLALGNFVGWQWSSVHGIMSSGNAKRGRGTSSAATPLAGYS